MSDLTKQAAMMVLDSAEKLSNNAIDVLGATIDLAAAAATAPINVGDQAADAALAEARYLIGKATKLLREIAEVVTEPLP